MAVQHLWCNVCQQVLALTTASQAEGRILAEHGAAHDCHFLRSVQKSLAEASAASMLS